MHKWLVDNNWIIDSTNAGSLFMSYTAFVFILPCPLGAIIQWGLGSLFGGPNAEH